LATALTPPRPASGGRLAVAVLVLLAAAAGAGVVASDLLLDADRGRGAAGPLLGGRAAAPWGRGRGGDGGERRGRVAHGGGPGGAPLPSAVERLAGLDLHAEEQLGDVEADVGLHLLEEVEALEGVLLQGVALAVAAQADALP